MKDLEDIHTALIGILILMVFVIIFLFIISIKTAHAGIRLWELDRSTIYIQIDKIAEMRRQAEKASQHGMSKERLEEIKRQAEEVLHPKAAMVFCSSEVIE